MIRISCPHCGTVLGVKNPQGGTNIACLKCKQRFILQHTQAAPLAKVVPAATPIPASSDGGYEVVEEPREETPESSKPGINPYALAAGGVLAVLAVGTAIFFAVRPTSKPTGEPPLAGASAPGPVPNIPRPVSGDNPIPPAQTGGKQPTATQPSAGGEPRTIGPAEAATKLEEEVTLQMVVKSASLRDGMGYLNSEEDFRDEKNFTLFLDRDALARFGQVGIEDPAAHFQGKTIQVTGKVTLYRNRPQIKVSGPTMIKVVEQK